ncbi:diaminopimelate decarboxylase [Corynebacterium sp. 320]|uniref:diaminopimelate decarboxylase n=1 Tax=Corynebacterium TaxID=1716 RepID=UPI00125CCFC9|nr:MULTISPECIES: diaminopimelate decarboxylase [Corynebacterium]KAB1503949.1 diaminopimelate decarboxylase [Corynebacterium sp. 320]KAB1552952.1 diaminopimelate decarboxylase [Corynebacterium sp. 321]KAB1553828.1 diaminopimelate decarboxylase [Corynebacterium sp. 319]KAB3528085.1 diaminopimelate decarboxylase [Corynebacterium sp. 250]KAB3540427.1 diaminopimelate decarboxylase [Corynebacterium sp. 366]
MDPETHLHSEPLKQKISSAAEFNRIPEAVYPVDTVRTPQGSVSIAGVDLTDIAEEYGTSAFVINEDDFRGRCRALAEAFDGGERVHYASKALLTREIARWVKEEGLALDVASQGELALALAAEFPADRITVHGNNKSDEFLSLAITSGAELIVVDSLQEIDRLSALAQQHQRTQDVLIRVTPGVHVDTHEFIATSHEDQKFGFSLAAGVAHDAAVRTAAAPGLRLRGLHCHVGSQVFEASGFALAAERLLGFWSQLLDELPADATASLDTLDLGGGYGIAYTADQEPLNVAVVAEDLKNKVAEAAKEAGVPYPNLNVEPGRAIAGPSMVTLYRVGTVKDVPVNTKLSRRYISVDGGMSDNIRPALYQAEYDFRVVNREVSGRVIPTRIVGSHCESGDILINDAQVPDDVQVGDLIMVGATGAYCYSMASRYNMMLRPPIIAIKDGQARVMVRRETLEDILSLDVF